MKFAKIYSDVDSLRKIDPHLLKELIQKFKEFFSHYYVIDQNGDIDFDQLCQVMMSLRQSDQESTPDALLDILHSVQEMSKPDRMEALLDRIRDNNPNYFKEFKEHGPTDVALYCRLYYPDIFDHEYALSQLSRKRSFSYFLGKKISQYSADIFSKIETPLRSQVAKWCQEHNRPSFVNCIITQRTQHITWIIVTHGEPLRREAKVSDSIDNHSIYYHPQKTDLLIYDSEKNRLQVKCDSKKLIKNYCLLIGELCFNDSEFFNEGVDPFTLAPICTALDIDYDWIQVQGIDSIRLSAVNIQHDDHIETRRSHGNYFNNVVIRNVKGEKLNIIKAVFKVKFSNQKNEREVTISKGQVSYIRNEDSFILEEWLAIHGFSRYATREISAHVCIV